MPGVIIDLTGKVFGRLTVLHKIDSYRDATGRPYIQYRCSCRCGNVVDLQGRMIKKETRRGCGNCRTKSRYPKAFGAYWNMMNRCHNPKHKQWDNYGGRGITVCDRWKEDVLFFIQDMGEPVDSSLSLDRIDNELGYYKENCRWVPMLVNINNTRRAHSANTVNKAAADIFMKSFVPKVKCYVPNANS